MLVSQAVWTDKYQKGVPKYSTSAHTTVQLTTLQDALHQIYTSDAHAPQYVVVGPDGKPCFKQQRINLDTELPDGYSVRYDSVWIDVDAHHIPAAEREFWWEAELDKIERLPQEPYWYRSSGGYRLVWPLIHSVQREHWAHFYTSLLAYLKTRYDISGDTACGDLSRCMRLPFVTRDGIPQEHDAQLDHADCLEFTPPRKTAAELVNDAQRSHASTSGLQGLPAFMAAVGLLGSRYRDNRWICECPEQHLHSTPAKVNDTSTVLIEAQDGGWFFHCSHASCAVVEHKLRDMDVALWDETVARGKKCSGLRAALPVSDLQDQLKTLLPTLLEQGGRHAVFAGVGSAKSQAALEAAVHAANAGARVAFAAPTNKLRSELADRIDSFVASDPWLALTHTEIVRSREPGYCDYTAEQAAIFRAGGADACNAMCGECPSQCGYRRTLRQKRFDGGKVAVMTHHMLYGDAIAEEWGAVIIDESPINGAALPMIAVSSDHVLRIMQRGALTGDAMPLLMLMVDKATQQELVASGCSLALGDGDELQAEVMRNLEVSPGAIVNAMQAMPDHRAAKALAEASANGWRACFVYDGVLQLPIPEHNSALERAGCVIYLDATGDTHTAAAVLGQDHTVHDLGDCITEGVSHIHYPWSASRRNIERRPEIAYAVHMRHDSPLTLHVTHKRLHIEDPRWDWRLQVKGRVTYFGAPDAKGSNDYSHYTSIVLDDYYVPNAALASMAVRLCKSGTPEGAAAALASASAQLVRREYVQTIGRLRLSRADDERTVAHIGRTELALGDLPAAEPGDIAEALYTHAGVLTAKRGAVLALLAKRMAKREGGLPIYSGRTIEDHKHVDGSNIRNCTLHYALRKLYAGDMHQLAQDLSVYMGQDIAVRLARMSRGNGITKIAMLYATPWPDDSILHLAAHADRAEWYEIDGARYYTAHNRVFRAATELEARGLGVTAEAVANRLQIHVESLRQSLRRRGNSLAQLERLGSRAVAPAEPLDPRSDISARAAKVTISGAPRSYQPALLVENVEQGRAP